MGNYSGSWSVQFTIYEKNDNENTTISNEDNNNQPNLIPDDHTSNGLKCNEKITISNGFKIKASLRGDSLSIIATVNKKSIKISSTIKIRGRTYPVTEIGKKAITGKRIRTVTINAKNLRIINKNAFKGAKNLDKVIIKGVSKRSKIAKQIVKAAKKANKKVRIVYK